MKAGLLLFAHGSRDARWAEPFEAVAARVRARAPALAVALAYLELMQPSIEEAATLLAGQGCTRVDVVPLFLGAGGHVRGDLPELLQRLRRAHAHVTWRLQPAIGAAPEVVAAMADAALRMAEGDAPAASAVRCENRGRSSRARCTASPAGEPSPHEPASVPLRPGGRAP